MPSTTMEATYRITTPMFCSGADQKKAELRLASFKGTLRFWWRALMWRETQVVKDLQSQEAALFGASNQDTGQSKVRLRMGAEELEKAVEPPEVFAGGRLTGGHYLGYGVMEAFASRKKGTQAGQLTRPMIPGGTFTVRCRLDGSLTQTQRKQVSDALVLVGTVGGMGSKSRKGFGSLTLTRLTCNGAPVELPEDPAERLGAVLGPLSALPQAQPEWTAWSALSKVVVVNEANVDAWELLDDLGREQMHFRSWGNNGMVIGQASERNFPEDHDLSKGQNVQIKHPKRVAFGLPHNYGKGDQAAVSAASKEIDRRASALFFHVHQVSDTARPVGVVAFLPARFLPESEQIRAFGQNVPLDTSPGFWEPVHGYLNRLTGAPGATSLKTGISGKEVRLG